MTYSNERLTQIFDKPPGKCHICCGHLAFRNYTLVGKAAVSNYLARKMETIRNGLLTSDVYAEVRNVAMKAVESPAVRIRRPSVCIDGSRRH